MRPQRLVARGFAAFRDEVELDFVDTDFFALVGPTGAGKSSVIDALCFALYGSVPRYEHESLRAPVITTNATEARVELDFKKGDERYRIVRIARRTGNAKVQLDRLSDDGSLAETLTSSARDARRIVPEIVGLKFDEFTKCVVLPQGAFATLLHAKDAARNELLTSLLDLGVYDRIASLAGDRERALDAEILADQRVLEELGATDDAALEAAAARVDALLALYKDVDAARAEAGVIAERLTATRAELVAAKRAVAALGAVRVAPEVTAAAAERETLTARVHAAELAHAAARAEIDATTRAAEQGTPLDVLRAVVQAHHQLVGLEDTRAKAASDQASAADALQRAASSLAAADGALAAARSALDACRTAHAAHALAVHLAVGEPCPVCEQVVESLDGIGSRRAPEELAHSEVAVTQATGERDQAQAILTEAERAAARVTAQVEALDGQRRELVAAVAPIPDADRAEEALATAEAATAAVDDARKRAGAAFDEEAAARRALAAFDGRVEAIATAFHDQRDAIAAAGVTGAPVPTGQLPTDWTELHGWARRAAGEWQHQVQTLGESCSTLERAAAAVVAQFERPLRELHIGGPSAARLDEIRDAVIEAGTSARHHHKRLVEARESAAQLTRGLAARRDQLEVARALRTHLRTNNFKTWLLGRAVVALAARATDRLLELSGGRYELVLGDGDDFEVVDRKSAGERRPVRSLSGGETFEASLALALALAEQVAALSASGASSLESIFLDEGFGTLDPEALELVAGAVETLGGEGRMVGIVTHVGALADRVPVRFRVANDGRTATVTREG